MPAADGRIPLCPTGMHPQPNGGPPWPKTPHSRSQIALWRKRRPVTASFSTG
ncbi:hypothetical protein ACFFX0_22480 [Citricoccus parietis]|uniref:Uncharacterized protein n=1 Tax=Citricoccus parietis TaxID=592307 RepID=A0ABV5G4F3_9MICC